MSGRSQRVARRVIAGVLLTGTVVAGTACETRRNAPAPPSREHEQSVPVVPVPKAAAAPARGEQIQPSVPGGDPAPTKKALALSEAQKIDLLLARLEKSDAVFIRNGSEYKGPRAAAHLRTKLESAGGKIKTAREFIEQLASKSSLSGKGYQVRTPDGKVVESREWFLGVLTEIEGER